MYTIKQHRPQSEDDPALLKFSGGLQFDACGRVDAENSPLSFHSSFGRLFDLPLVQWEVFASVDATDVTRCLQANL